MIHYATTPISSRLSFPTPPHRSPLFSWSLTVALRPQSRKLIFSALGTRSGMQSSTSLWSGRDLDDAVASEERRAQHVPRSVAPPSSGGVRVRGCGCQIFLTAHTIARTSSGRVLCGGSWSRAIFGEARRPACIRRCRRRIVLRIMLMDRMRRSRVRTFLDPFRHPWKLSGDQVVRFDSQTEHWQANRHPGSQVVLRASRIGR